jgi:hypothetical protein
MVQKPAILGNKASETKPFKDDGWLALTTSDK